MLIIDPGGKPVKQENSECFSFTRTKCHNVSPHGGNNPFCVGLVATNRKQTTWTYNHTVLLTCEKAVLIEVLETWCAKIEMA